MVLGLETALFVGATRPQSRAKQLGFHPETVVRHNPVLGRDPGQDLLRPAGPDPEPHDPRFKKVLGQAHEEQWLTFNALDCGGRDQKRVAGLSGDDARSREHLVSQDAFWIRYLRARACQTSGVVERRGDPGQPPLKYAVGDVTGRFKLTHRGSLQNDPPWRQ